MKNKRTAVIAVTFFLVQAITLAGVTTAETLSLNPPTRLAIIEANIPFRQVSDILCSALSLYKADAFQRLSKEELIKSYNFARSGSGVLFDLDRLDFGRKGWTRYYPFSVGEKRFVARIFLTSETYFQPKIAAISEVIVEDMGVTIQILPSLSEILNDCKIKPNRAYQPSQAEKNA